MMRLLLTVLTLLLFFTACKKESNNDQNDPPEQGKQIDIASVDDAVASFMSNYAVPGASLAVSKNGKLVYVKGFGKANKETNEEVTPDHVFRLASVSKTYTGVAILKLIEEGKIPSLESKVFGTGGVLGTDYGTPPYKANLSNITIRDLLHNTSGSWGSATGGDVIDQNPGYNFKQFYDWVINSRPNPSAPGTVYNYSNVGYNLLGRIIEKVSGKSFINYVKQDLVASLGDTKTDLAGKTEAEKKTKEVKYYGQGSDANYVYNIAFPRRDADGGLITSATDLLRLVNAVDGFPSRPDILNSNSIKLFTTTPTAVSSFYACGIAIWTAENVWYNYGSLPGTRTGFMRHANGTSVAFLLNTRANPTNENAFIQAMQALMLNFVKNTTIPWQSIDQFK